MTRIETALARMWKEAAGPRIGPLAPAMVATPTGQALAALVEAAEAWQPRPTHGREILRLAEAVDAFRAATEPQP